RRQKSSKSERKPAGPPDAVRGSAVISLSNTVRGERSLLFKDVLSSVLAQSRLVCLQKLLDRFVPIEPALNPFGPNRPHFLPSRGVVEQTANRFGQFDRRILRDVERRLAG